MQRHKYQPFWCEENVWHLAQGGLVDAEERWVWIVSGPSGRVACWQQRAAKEGEALLWDYHVVLAARAADWQVWDLDTRLGAPVPAQQWLRETFPVPQLVPARFQPRFMPVEAERYVAGFDSDRAHMKIGRGEFLKPPPPWAPIRGCSLPLAVLLLDARRGLSLEALLQWLNRPARPDPSHL